MTTVYIIVALALGAPLYGHALRLYDQARTRRRWEMQRVQRFPAVLARIEPHIEPEPWPRRQTPTDLEAAYEGERSALPYQPLHASHEVAATRLDYFGFHRALVGVTAEYEALTREALVSA